MMSSKCLFRFIEPEQTRDGGDDRTITVTFSSEEPVLRRDHLEVLSHRDGDYDLHRLSDGGAVLFNHDVNKQIGVVERAWVEQRGGRRVGRAKIRFSRHAFAEEIYQDVKDGIRSKISFGYEQNDLLSSSRGTDGVPVNRFSWTALEVSIVPTPADITVGVDREFESKLLMTRNLHTQSAFDRLAQSLLGEKRQAPTLAETIRSLVVVNQPEVKDESARVAESMKNLPGSRMGMGASYVSFETLRRDLSVSTFGQGGALVGEQMLPHAYPLSNKTIAEKCGAKIITGLTGNCFLPRFTSLPQVTNATEVGATALVTPSTPATDQIYTKPHRVSVQCVITRELQLLSPTTTSALAQLMTKALATAIDFEFLYGGIISNNDAPLGIFQTPGIGSAVFGGPASFAPIVNLEQSLTGMNVECDPATTWYVTSPQGKAKLKQVAKSSGVTQAIWESIAGMDYMNGYRAKCSNQILNNTVGLVDFSETALCIYGDGIEIIYNPYSQDTQGEVRVTANCWIDVLVDHAQAIAITADAATQ